MSESWSSAPAPSASPAAGGRRVTLVVAGAVVALLVAGGVGFVLGRSSSGPSPSQAADAVDARKSRLTNAVAACQGQASDGTLALEDDGATIVVGTGGKSGDLTGMDCVLSMLGTPGSIQAQMGRTTATMGSQEAEHEGIRYSWSNHPDDGVHLVITEAGTGS